jgi:hypothetical protein
LASIILRTAWTQQQQYSKAGAVQHSTAAAAVQHSRAPAKLSTRAEQSSTALHHSRTCSKTRSLRKLPVVTKNTSNLLSRHTSTHPRTHQPPPLRHTTSHAQQHSLHMRLCVAPWRPPWPQHTFMKSFSCNRAYGQHSAITYNAHSGSPALFMRAACAGFLHTPS